MSISSFLRKGLYLALSVAIMAIAFTGCNSKSEVDTAKDEASIEVNNEGDKGASEVNNDSNKDAGGVNAYGVIKSGSSKNISLPFSAEVLKVLVNEGDTVTKGTPLMEISLTQQEKLIRNAEMNTDKAILELNKLEKELSHQRLQKNKENNPNLKRLVFNSETTKTALDKLEKELVQKSEMMKSGTITKSEFDTFEERVIQKRNELKELELAFESEIAGIDTQIRQYASAYELKQKEIEILKVILEDLLSKKNRADINDNVVLCDTEVSIITDILCSEGDILLENTRCISLINVSELYVEAEVAEEFIVDVKEGARVKIIPLADKTKSYTGEVEVIQKRAVTSNGETNVYVKISIKDNDGFLIPGFNVDVEIGV